MTARDDCSPSLSHLPRHREIGDQDLAEVADSILAAGWRPVPVERLWSPPPCLTCGAPSAPGGFCEAHS